MVVLSVVENSQKSNKQLSKELPFSVSSILQIRQSEHFNPHNINLLSKLHQQDY